MISELKDVELGRLSGKEVEIILQHRMAIAKKKKGT
jgi:hypothetical protein